MCIISQNSINHPTKNSCNFTNLQKDSIVDNVYLEYRLAQELFKLGMVEKIIPIFVGRFNDDTKSYSDYFSDGSKPDSFPTTHIESVEKQLKECLGKLGLGTPYFENQTINKVMEDIYGVQGIKIQGEILSLLLINPVI